MTTVPSDSLVVFQLGEQEFALDVAAVERVLPVTLATFKGILVSVGGQTFVIPTAKIERIARVRLDDIRTVENRETIALDGQAVARERLDEVLALPAAERRPGRRWREHGL